jgi:aminoglycoside phosphotransferase (APT) family kinase protein
LLAEELLDVRDGVFAGGQGFFGGSRSLVRGGFERADVLSDLRVGGKGRVDLGNEAFAGGFEFAQIEAQAEEFLQPRKQGARRRRVLGCSYVVWYVRPEARRGNGFAAKRVVDNADDARWSLVTGGREVQADGDVGVECGAGYARGAGMRHVCEERAEGDDQAGADLAAEFDAASAELAPGEIGFDADADHDVVRTCGIARKVELVARPVDTAHSGALDGDLGPHFTEVIEPIGIDDGEAAGAKTFDEEARGVGSGAGGVIPAGEGHHQNGIMEFGQALDGECAHVASLAAAPGVRCREMVNLELVGSGREAEVYAWGEGTVLRLLRGEGGREQLEREALALKALAAAGVRAPAPGEIVSLDGRMGMVMERVAGDDLLTQLRAAPWRASAVGRITAEVQAALHGVEAPPGLVELREGLRARLRHPAVPPALGARALATLETLPDGDRICHGDLHPANLIGQGPHPAIIDWTNVTRGDPAGDFARTLVILRAGQLPEGTPALLRAAALVLRRFMVRAFRSRYLAISGTDVSRLGEWVAVQAAARLVEGIDGEAQALLGMAAQGLPPSGP